MNECRDRRGAELCEAAASLQTRPAGGLPAPIPSVGGEAASCSRLTSLAGRHRVCPAVGSLKSLGCYRETAEFLGVCLAAVDAPMPGVGSLLPACGVAQERGLPWCRAQGALPARGVGSCCSERPCGAGLPVLSRAGRGFPLMWVKRLSNTAQEALIQPFPCSCNLL